MVTRWYSIMVAFFFLLFLCFEEKLVGKKQICDKQHMQIVRWKWWMKKTAFGRDRWCFSWSYGSTGNRNVLELGKWGGQTRFLNAGWFICRTWRNAGNKNIKQPLETCMNMIHLHVVGSELLAIHMGSLIVYSCFGWWHFPASPLPIANFSFSGTCLALAVTHLLPDPRWAKIVLSLPMIISVLIVCRLTFSQHDICSWLTGAAIGLIWQKPGYLVSLS